MPKQEISHRAGHRLEEKLRQFLGQFFSDSDLERVERLGGRITISMAVSDTQRRKKGEHVVIDEALVKELQTLRNSPDDFHARLRRLTVSELQRLSALVGHPNRPAATAAEMRAALLRYFQSDDVWRGIAGPRASE